MSELYWENSDNNLISDKKTVSELIKDKNLLELNIDELSNIIVDSKDFDLSKEENKIIAKRFLEETAKKTLEKNKIEESDISWFTIWYERQAFRKILDLVKVLSNKKEIESKIFWFTGEELNLLQNYMEWRSLVVEQTKETTNIVKNNINKIVEIKEESKEKREELKLEKDEEKAIIKYLGLEEKDFEDINFASAISVMSKGDMWTEYNTWKMLWYESDWFFGETELAQLNSLSGKINMKKLNKIIKLQNDWIKIKDLINTREILKKSSADKVFEVIFDYNTDGNVDASDNHINNSVQILNYSNKMIKEWKSEKLFSSISHLIWEKVIDKASLYNLLIDEPELKFKLINEIKKLTASGDVGSTFVTDVLEHWEDATNISMEKKKEANKYINSILESQRPNVDRLYEQSLEKFKKDLSTEDRIKYEALISSLSSVESKKSIFENFRLNWAWILVNLVDWHKWVWWAASFTNENVNDFLTKNTETIVKWLNFEIGITNFGGQIVPGIWMSIDLSKDLSSETRAFWKIGFINIIPYALAGLETQINADTIKKSGFADLSDSTKYAGATINVSTFWWGLWVHYRKDQLKSIETQEKSFIEFMNNLISNDGIINEDLVKSQEDYSKNKDYYDNLISNIKETLRIQNFTNLSAEYKKEVIISIKHSYAFVWRESILKEAQKKGYEFSGIWFGIEFIAWFMPIPVVGASVSKVWITYDENKMSKLYAIITESKNVVIKKETTQNDGEILSSSSEINTGMDFIWNKSLFRNFAQNHPQSWKKLVTTKSLSSNEEASLVLTMFKADKSKNTKFFKEFINKAETYKKSTNEDDKRKLNELIAWFYDISFADIRSTSEVIMGYTKKWNKYEWSFNFQEAREKAMKKFASSEGLSVDFVNQNQDIVEEIRKNHEQELKDFKSGKSKNAPEILQIKDPTLFALVTSYKINWKWESLGKWLVDIPAGQANIADWKTKDMQNSKDINYLVNSFCETTSGKNTMNQLINTINTKETNLISWPNDFKDLLKNWFIEKNWKKVSIDRDFLYFLYGQCANESMWLRIKWLKFEWFNASREEEKVTYGNIAPDWVLAVQANTTNIPRWILTTLAAWIVWNTWDERKNENNNQAPVNSNPTTENNNPTTPPVQGDQ